MEEKKRVHDKECAMCKKLFECKVKTEDVKSCVSFEERKVKEK